MSHILLVTTMPVDQQIHTALLESGHTLVVTHEPELARQQVHHQPPSIAILALDIQTIPVQALCRWLKTHTTSLVLVTASTSEQRTIALEAGADELLSQPLEPVEVQQRLRTLHQITINQNPTPQVEKSVLDSASLLGTNTADILGNVDLLSHDLRNPLGIIISSLELVLDFQRNRIENGNPEIALEARLSENAWWAAHRLLNLINDMIDHAKIEVNAYPIIPHSVNLVALVQHVLNKHTDIIQRKGIIINVTYPSTFPEISGDTDLISRIVTALLDNTLKFTNEGQRADITFSTKGNDVFLRLSDTGRPILPEYAATIFERTGQWEARQEGGRSSVALGLPFAYAAAQLMNGDLTASTDLPTKTTTFNLRLPVVR